MNNSVVNEICEIVRNGGTYRVSQTHWGQARIKLAYGPFGIIKKRYRVDYLSLFAIRDRLCKHTLH